MLDLTSYERIPLRYRLFFDKTVADRYADSDIFYAVRTALAGASIQDCETIYSFFRHIQNHLDELAQFDVLVLPKIVRSILKNNRTRCERFGGVFLDELIWTIEEEISQRVYPYEIQDAVLRIMDSHDGSITYTELATELGIEPRVAQRVLIEMSQTVGGIAGDGFLFTLTVEGDLEPVLTAQ